MKIGIVILLVIHGLMHFLGINRLVKEREKDKSRTPIGHTTRIAWYVTGFSIVFSAALIIFHISIWWIPIAIGIVVSQYLIIRLWSVAKYGTWLNCVFFCMAVVGFAQWNYVRNYSNDVKQSLAACPKVADVLTEGDIEKLPYTIQKYIRSSGCIDKPKVNSFRVTFSGQIRDYEKKEWMPLTSEQYNIVNSTTRLFFLNATMKGLPVAGYHSFRDGSAFMDIRLLSLFTVQYQDGDLMNQSETVTFFNDMCVLAPATLIDSRIQWKEIDTSHVEAVFTSNGISISASLYFNATGELINFISHDRYALTNGEMKQLSWSTPILSYKSYGDYKLASEAQAIYTYEDGDFCYGEFETVVVIYNPR